MALWWRLLLVGCLVAGTQAFHPAPIRWGGRLDKRLLLTSTGYLGRVALPQQLTVKEDSGMIFRNEILRFSTNQDNTISCGVNDMRWCLDANGTERGHVVFVNHCTGRAAQKWKWLASGPIQLEGTNQCIHVTENRGLTSARVELRDCDNKASEIWTLEYTTPSPVRSSLQYPPSSILSFAVAMIAAALSFAAWLWWWRKEARMVGLSDGAALPNMNEGGLCLTEAMAMRSGDMPLAAGMIASTPTLMASGNPCRFNPNKTVMKFSSKRKADISSPVRAPRRQGRAKSERELQRLNVTGGTVRGRRLITPGVYLRPMMARVREAMFSMLVDTGVMRDSARVLDLFAGSGAIGIESLSRGMGEATFVDFSRECCETIQTNVETVGFADRACVVEARVDAFLANPAHYGCSLPYDLITLTPPYEEVVYAEMVQQLAASPALGDDTLVVIEYPIELGCFPQMLADGQLFGIRNRRYGRTVLCIYINRPSGNIDVLPYDEEFVSLKKLKGKDKAILEKRALV